MLPSALPLFPLPNAVLFPRVFLPLHVFEPRYREMVGDALATDRVIGMVLLKPGWEANYDGRPAVFPVGCAGVITHHERLPDGRYQIVLRGVDRFRILEEDDSRTYRLARVATEPEPGEDGSSRELDHARARLEALLMPSLESHRAHFPAAMPTRDLVNALAQYLDLEPLERQALLERPGTQARCQGLIELLEIKTFSARVCIKPNGVQ